MWFSPKYRHEIFLSHAVEDKISIADELSKRLKQEGLKVWYSGDELSSGGDIYKDIEKAIDQSRFGVVVFSKTFIDKTWTRKELSWLEKKETDKIKVILPVLHEMTIEELAAFDVRIASKFCINANRGIEVVVKKIRDEINKEKTLKRAETKRHAFWATSVITGIIAIISFLAFQVYNHKPTDIQIENSIQDRVQGCLNSIDGKYIRPFQKTGISIHQSQIDSLRRAYREIKSSYRNEYEFNSYIISISGRKRVENHLGINLVDLADLPGYGFSPVETWWSSREVSGGWRNTGFSLINKQPVEFSWTGKRDKSNYVVTVTYKNNLRFINVSLSTPPTTAGTKRHEMFILGFSPTETYYFEEGSDNEWYLLKIE